MYTPAPATLGTAGRALQQRFAPSVAPPAHAGARAQRRCAPRAQRTATEPKPASKGLVDAFKEKINLGDVLGPIGLTYGGDVKGDEPISAPAHPAPAKKGLVDSFTEKIDLGDVLGPIGLTYGGEVKGDEPSGAIGAEASGRAEAAERAGPARPLVDTSISELTTAEWRAKYERDGTVDLWVEEEFNSGSRLVGGRDVYKGGLAGYLTGEGRGASTAQRHKVVIHNHYADQVVEVQVPEDRYVLWEAEDEGLELPYACRMGCCTACAVKVVSGEMYQPEALGVSTELREKGYALMCVAYPRTDVVLETVPEDEVYDLQFGLSFASQALNPDGDAILRDDYALEIAQMDE